MEITEPQPEELQRITQQFAYRLPEVAHITVVGDRGAQVRLPFILGNPLATCKLPPGRRPTSLWSDFLAAVLKRDRLASTDDAAVECILYPDGATWGQWANRWPALADQVWRAVRKK